MMIEQKHSLEIAGIRIDTSDNFTNKEERLETISENEKGKWIKAIGEKSINKKDKDNITKRVFMSLKLIIPKHLNRR